MAAKRPTRAVKLLGTTAPDTRSRRLAAGPLSVELDNGALRYVRFNGVEVLRAVAFLVRDENWGTFTPEIRGLKVRQGRGGFRVSYEARLAADARRVLDYRVDIVGQPDGSLRFDAAARAETDFPTNRTGFIVLHPLSGVAGRPVEVEHVDGHTLRDKFPALVSPLQPFYDIRALSHEVVPGVRATVRMEGDSFEMEDHRNWTDASFKTYVRPLALPWPYTIPAGTEFAQSVALDIAGKARLGRAAAGGRRLRVEIGRAAGGVMPRIGLGVPADEAAPALAAADLIKRLGPQLLVCRVDLRRGHEAALLGSYRRLAQASGAEIVLEIVIPGTAAPRDELAPLARDVAASGLRLAAVAVSPAADLRAVLPGSKGPVVPPLEDIYAAARAVFPGTRLGGGTFAFFTELNRKPPPTRLLDFVTHTTCPIVHAADDRSTMETLEALPYVIESTRSFIGDAAYRVGPSAIGARDNPYGAATAANPDNGRVCLAAMDPRQRGLFGAAWTLGYVAAFARGGAEAVTMGAPTGSSGAIYRRTDTPQPYFDGLSGPAVYPLFHVLAGLARAAGQRLVAAVSSDPAALACLAYRGPAGPVLWLANLTAAPHSVALAGLSGRPTVLSLLDEDSFVAATTDPDWFDAAARQLRGAASLRLGAYAVACLEAVRR